MLSITKTMTLHGLQGFLIDVQVDVSAGMPAWDIVGLPDTSVKEAKERVRTAIKNSGYELFSRPHFRLANCSWNINEFRHYLWQRQRRYFTNR